MRAEIVHVTDHAILRWRERAAKHADEGVDEIINAVKQSKVLKKSEPLPYPLPRLPNSVYSMKDEILFVLESVTITEYRLVTVITRDIGFRNFPSNPRLRKQPSFRFCSEKTRIEQRRAVAAKKKENRRTEPKEIPNKVPPPYPTASDILTFKPVRRGCYHPPLVLNDEEKSLVRDTMMEAARDLGLVVNL
jgi:hypothetical protein